jgi:hypothetical protein
MSGGVDDPPMADAQNSDGSKKSSPGILAAAEQEQGKNRGIK